ncbi:tyrosine-type recombinase/integrase [Georgenia daeguensis]|uniref:Site-specific integrase n=1 Tax=Georgenia daeguensis TaxID=908355 RepID=A0ABP8EQA9_9MICO
MASGSVAKRQDGRWRARYRGPDGRERARHFDRKTDAQRWLAAETAKMGRGEWTDPTSGKVTVGEYGAEWLASKVRLKHSTRTSYESLLRYHVAPTWGRVPLSSVRHEDVAAWVQRLHGSGLSASRTRQAWIVLSQVLDMAVRSRRIPHNPARGVELPSLPKRTERPARMLTGGQVWALADAVGERHALEVLILAWCGLRFGELAALRVSEVDVLRREMHVNRTLSEVGGVLIEGTPKTDSSVRRVPVPPWLMDMLAPTLAGRGGEDRALTAPDGGDLRLGNWRTRVFDPAVRAVGIAAQDGGDVFRPHDLRHTCASLHIQAGTPPKVLSEMLGHASVSITLDRYGHLYPGDVHQYVDRLGEAALVARADFLRTRDAVGVVPLVRDEVAQAV